MKDIEKNNGELIESIESASQKLPEEETGESENLTINVDSSDSSPSDDISLNDAQGEDEPSDESGNTEISDSSEASESENSEKASTEKDGEETKDKKIDASTIPLPIEDEILADLRRTKKKSELAFIEQSSGESTFIIPEKQEDPFLHPDEIFSSNTITRKSASDADPTVEGGEQISIAEIDEDLSASDNSSAEEENESTIYADEEMPEYSPKKPRKLDGRFDFIELCIFTLVVVMLITTFLFKHSVVSGDSMQNTLQNGEHLIISDLFYTPKRGDIIVCEDHTTAIRTPIVKRVIAVEGDRVKINAAGVFVNGELLVEDYVFIDNDYYVYSDFEEIIIPEGELFVLGDHRNESADSRIIGTVSEDSVLGRVLLRFYPFNKFGTVE